MIRDIPIDPLLTYRARMVSGAITPHKYNWGGGGDVKSEDWMIGKLYPLSPTLTLASSISTAKVEFILSALNICFEQR